MLKNCPTGGSSGEVGIANGNGGVPLKATPPARPGPRAGSHNPEKSGFPSGIRGGGAERSILPSLVLGPVVGYSGHCANKTTAPVVSAADKAADILGFSSCFYSTPNASTTFPWEPPMI